MQGKRMSKGWKTFAIWCTLILLFFAFFSFFRNQPRSDPWRTTQAFKTDLEANRIESVTPGRGFLVVTDDEGERYRVPGVLDGSLWKDLASHGVRVGAPATDQSSAAWPSFLTSWLPLLALVAVFVFLMRKMGGAQSIFALRKTTARLANTPSVTFAHVGGAGEAKERLADIVDFLKRPRAWEAAGAYLPSGVLLEGPPGCGKTLLARAMAGEAKVPFFEVSASEFVELFVGVGATRMRDLFEQAGNGDLAIENEDFQAALAARNAKKGDFDQLDALLIESGSQLSQPNGKVVLRAILQDGSELTGEVVWADDHFLKLRASNGSATAVAKRSIARIEPIGDSAPEGLEQIFQERLARMTPDSV